jgi:phage terminase large subunit-like protein
VAKIALAMGQPFMPWQRQVADVALEVMPGGLPAYREVRLTVPRQSGKTTELLAVEVDRCLNWGRRQRCLYAAQDRNNSRAKWEEQGEILDGTPLRPLFTMRRQTGLERMVWRSTASTIGITASGESSGHGQTLDLGVIDEAFAQKDERLAQAFRPAMLTRPSAQMWIVSTMGTDESTFLNDRVDDGRARVEDGQRSGVCYFEWSAHDDDDPDDEDTWWRCMPALGHTVTVDTIRADHDSLDAGEFARAYLNRRAAGGKPVIDSATWAACSDPQSQPGPLLAMGLDVTPDREHSSIGVASRRRDGRIHIEVVDRRGGTDWVVARMLELQRQWHPARVMFDPASPAGSLRLDLAAAGVAMEGTEVRTYAQACGAFYDDAINRKLAHRSQPALDAAVAGARKRNLGDAWAWARRVGADVSPLVAVTLARWALLAAGEGSAQIL